MEQKSDQQSISISSSPNINTDDTANDNSEDNAQEDINFSELSGKLYENHQYLVEQTRAFGNDYEPVESSISPITNEVDNDLFFSPEDNNSEDNAQEDIDFSELSGKLYENHQYLVEQTRAFGNDYEPVEFPIFPITNQVDNYISSTPDDIDFGDRV